MIGVRIRSDDDQRVEANALNDLAFRRWLAVCEASLSAELRIRSIVKQSESKRVVIRGEGCQRNICQWQRAGRSCTIEIVTQA